MSISIKCTRFIIMILFSALLMNLNVTPGLAQTSPAIEAALKQIMEAIQANDYDQFMTQADSAFKNGFSRSKFETLSQMLGPRLQKGYESIYFGQLNQQGYVVQVWKLALKDGQGDYLLTVFFKEGKVSGFVAH